MLAELWRRAVVWAFEPDPDYEYGTEIWPDPPPEDPYIRLRHASSALHAAQDEWARAVAGLAARRVDR